MSTKSGRFWVTWAETNARNSDRLDDLAAPFRDDVKTFVRALEDAGAKVTIRATRRSDKRAYLFHWSWKIGLRQCRPSEAAAMADVDIQWDHGDDNASAHGAREMIEGFGLAVPPKSTNAPSTRSKHIDGTAVDMDIIWNGELTLRKKDGTIVHVPFVPNVNQNTGLHEVGASYGVKKLATDAPHWSDSGH